MKIVEYGYPHSNALLQSHLKLELCKQHKAARHLMKCGVIDDVILSQIFDVIQSNVALQKQVHYNCIHDFIFQKS